MRYGHCKNVDLTWKPYGLEDFNAQMSNCCQSLLARTALAGQFGAWNERGGTAQWRNACETRNCRKGCRNICCTPAGDVLLRYVTPSTPQLLEIMPILAGLAGFCPARASYVGAQTVIKKMTTSHYSGDLYWVQGVQLFSNIPR